MHLTVTHALAAEPAAVWRLLADGGRVERWFPWVAATIVDDPREGGLRRIELEDGAFDEHITLNDEATRTYQYYAAEPPLPFRHVIGTIRIGRHADGAVSIGWYVSFEVTPETPPDFIATLRGLYAQALERIDAVAVAS